MGSVLNPLQHQKPMTLAKPVNYKIKSDSMKPKRHDTINKQRRKHYIQKFW